MNLQHLTNDTVLAINMKFSNISYRKSILVNWQILSKCNLGDTKKSERPGRRDLLRVKGLLRVKANEYGSHELGC